MKELGTAILITAVVALLVPLAVNARGPRALPAIPTPGPATAVSAAPAAPTAAATAAAPEAPAAPGTVNVDLLDTLKLTANPVQAPAGNVTFHAVDKGQIQHELKVVKTDLAPEALPVANGTVDEKQVNVVAKTAVLSGGKSQDISANLQAGKYVLICNVPAHYGAGMHAAFTVQ